MGLAHNGKVYRYDTPEARKTIQDITSNNKLNLVMIYRLPNGI